MSMRWCSQPRKPPSPNAGLAEASGLAIDDGILVDELPGFVAQLREMGLNPQGLMCIPPEAEDPRPHFRLLRELAEGEGLDKLSMGMSADFEAAIAEGATHVRVGSAIFGQRHYPQP